MNLLRSRRGQEVMAPPPEEIYFRASDILTDIYRDSVKEKEELERQLYVVNPEQLQLMTRGKPGPSQILGTIALRDRLPVIRPDDPTEALDPIASATGKEATIQIVRGSDPMGNNTQADMYALLNWREAPGKFYQEALRQELQKKGRAWEFEGSRRRIAAFRYDSNLNDFVLVGAVSDNHPVPQIPFFARPNPAKAGEYEFAYSIPRFPVLVDEQYYHETGKRRVRDDQGEIVDEIITRELANGDFTPFLQHHALEGIYVLDRMAEEKVKDPQDLKGGITQSQLNSYYKLPIDELSSFAYRAAQLYNSLIGQAKEYGNRRLNVNPFELSDDQRATVGLRIYEAALCHYALARIKKDTQSGKGLFGSIGLLDTTDPSMQMLTDRMTLLMKQERPDFNYEDWNDRALLQGAVILEHNKGAAPKGSMEKRLFGSAKGEQITGIETFLNTPMANYKGFRRWAEVIDEWNSGRVEGLPKAPGFMFMTQVPKGSNERGPIYETVLFVDIDEAPGYMAEWFNHNPEGSPWNFYYEPTHSRVVTLKGILGGQFTRKQVGLEELRNSSHFIVTDRGDQRDADGVRKGFNHLKTIGPGQCFTIDVPIAVREGKGKTASLVPLTENVAPVVSTALADFMSPKDIMEKRANRKEIEALMAAGEVVPMKHTIPNTAHVDGHYSVVGGIVDNHLRPHLVVRSEQKKQEELDELKKAVGDQVEVLIPKAEINVAISQ